MLRGSWETRPCGPRWTPPLPPSSAMSFLPPPSMSPEAPARADGKGKRQESRDCGKIVSNRWPTGEGGVESKHRMCHCRPSILFVGICLHTYSNRNHHTGGSYCPKNVPTVVRNSLYKHKHPGHMHSERLGRLSALSHTNCFGSAESRDLAWAPHIASCHTAELRCPYKCSNP